MLRFISIVLFVLFLISCRNNVVTNQDIEKEIAGEITENFDDIYYSCINNCEGWDLPTGVDITTSADSKQGYCTDLCRNEYYYRVTENATSVEFCFIINHTEIRKRCENRLHYNLAIKYGNLTLCNSISDEIKVDKCKKEIIRDKAIEQNDIMICDEWREWKECKDVISAELALINDNASLCDLILDETKKSTCINDAIPNMVLNGGDISLCKKLTNESLIKACMALRNLIEINTTPSAQLQSLTEKQIIFPSYSRGVPPGAAN
jgi:hypothetical protein